MTITKIQATFSHKIGLPNYSSATFSSTLEATLSEGEDFEAANDTLFLEAHKEVASQVGKFFGKQLQKVSEGTEDPDWLKNGDTPIVSKEQQERIWTAPIKNKGIVKHE